MLPRFLLGVCLGQKGPRPAAQFFPDSDAQTGFRPARAPAGANRKDCRAERMSLGRAGAGKEILQRDTLTGYVV